MGWAATVTVNGTSGIKLTVVVTLMRSLVAVISAVPAMIELIEEVALPLSVEAGEIGLPRLVAKLTLVPSGTGLPN